MGGIRAAAIFSMQATMSVSAHPRLRLFTYTGLYVRLG